MSLLDEEADRDRDGRRHLVEEIKQLLERLVVPRLDVIAKQLEGLRKQSDSMESGMREFRRSLGFLNLAKKDRPKFRTWMTHSASPPNR